MKQFYLLLISFFFICTASTNAIASVGEPSQFGDNVWNVHAWNAGDANGVSIPGHDDAAQLFINRVKVWRPLFANHQFAGELRKLNTCILRQLRQKVNLFLFPSLSSRFSTAGLMCLDMVCKKDKQSQLSFIVIQQSQRLRFT